MDRHRPALSARVRGRIVRLPAAGRCRSRSCGVFFVYPVVSILALGLAPDGSLDLGAALAVLAPAVRPRRRLVHALAGDRCRPLLTLLVGLPAAWVFARFDFPGRRLIGALAIVPFVLPTVVVAAAFLALLGPRSPFGIRLDDTILAILAAHVFYNVAVVLRLVGGVWSHLDPRTEEAARVLGASPWQAFRRVTLPLLRPAIASAASIVFLFTFTSFGVILLLGGPAVATLEVEIYRQTAVLLNLRTAAVAVAPPDGGAGGCCSSPTRAPGAPRRASMRLLPRGRAARRPRTRAERARRRGQPGRHGRAAGLAAGSCSSSARSPARAATAWRTSQALLDTDQRSALFVPPIEAIAQLARCSRYRDAHRAPLGLLAALVIAYGAAGCRAASTRC